MKQLPRPFVVIAILALFLVSSPALAAQDASQEIEDITDVVSKVRGLDALHPVEVTVKSREELSKELADTLLDDYPEDEQYADERELTAFGLMDENIDLGQLSVDLYSEQIAGYYDPETGEMVVIRDASDDSGFSPSEEVTYAHETVHALQDQNFDLMSDKLDREDMSDDESLAVTALIEGDASYSEVQYLYDNSELLDKFLKEIDAMEFNSDVLDSAPPILSETLLFPYDSGFTFVEALHDEGGWDAVNAAYDSPPVSTEQILHSEKYLSGEAPVPVNVPDFTRALGDDWTVFDDNTFGEYQIRVMFQQTSMSDEQAVKAAAGWDGDTYIVAGTDAQDAIHWVSEWESADDASQFARGLALYESERWDASPTYLADDAMQFEGDGVVTQIVVDGTTVDYVKAPSADMLETIASAKAPSATPMATPSS